MAIEALAAGSLIIPMDVTYQDKGMFLAYGLVYRLLDNGIPVKWAIKDNKAYGATDFSATTRNYTIPAETPTSKSYAGGPFIVPAANAAAAGAIINAYQSANQAEFSQGLLPVVHVATVGFNADIAYTLSRAPRIAMEDKNSSIMIKYLNTAKVPDSNGSTWVSSSPGVLTETEIDNGALFGIDRSQIPPPQEVCLKRAYDVFLSPHTSDGTWQGTPAANDLVDFLETGGFLHATCHSMSALNNYDAGPMLNPIGQTNYGDNKGDASTFTVDLPDYPSAQAVPRGPAAVQDLPGGSEQTWLHTDVTYFPSVFVLAHFLDNSTQYDFMAGGSFRGTGAGVVVFEGGHEYKDTDKIPSSESYSTVTDSVYHRFVLNTVFASVGKPYLEMIALPQNVSATALTPATFTLLNTGGAPALYTSPFVVTLAPFVSYTPGTAIPVPDSEVMMGGQWVLTWNAGTLPGGPGIVATIPAVIDPTLVGGTIPSGKNQAITYQGSWNDAYNQTASINTCTAITALPGAAPNMLKTPLNQSVTPNALTTWNINVSNNGTLPIDSALGPPPFIITDTLPAGWVYDPGTTTTPASVVPGPGGTTIITWQCPASCPPMLDPLLPTASFIITLGAFAPSATTATYTNLVNLQGTDGTTNFNTNTQAQVNVVNRPPTVTVDNPVQGDISCTGVNIQWTASDPDGDTPLEITLFYSSNGPGGPFTKITTVPDPLLDPPAVSFFWNTTGLPSGSSYVVKVVVSDGELSSEALSGVFIVDNTAPAVSWISPANGDLLSSTPVTLQASATDNIGVTSVSFEYSYNGSPFTPIGSGLPVGGNIYETNWEIAGLNQGDYMLRVTAADQCLNTSQQIIDVIVNIPPEVTLLTPPPPDPVCPPGTNITWIATDENPNATLTFTLQYSRDGGSFTTIATGIPGPCPCSYPWVTTALISGSYVLKVIASDGISTTEDVSDPFIVDNEPPQVNWITPPNNTYLTGNELLSANASDNVGVSSVIFEYDSTTIGPGFPDDGTYSTTWDTTMVADGSYVLTVTASDGCNNTATDTINITVDNTPPTVEIVSPPEGEVEGIVNLLISAQDNECLEKVELYIDGQLVTTEPGNGDTSVEFIYEWDTTEITEGPHTVTTIAYDCAGLTDEDEKTYIVNNLPEHFAQVLVDGELTIPEVKPDVEIIISFDVTPEVNDINIFNTIDGTKVTVTGFVEIGITYSTTGSQAEHFAHFNVPFHAMVLFPGLPLNAKVEPVIIVEHKQWHLLDPRTIKKDIVLFVGIKQVC
ncbi:Ig-like domain-containing protein [Phosphitispora sp. TUW77]|uniref:Ig-like domain-containing protein n=1 Tax=Phosphitispora sp. TUW77 TaxID=3152361 RepID=UPI003AB113D9